MNKENTTVSVTEMTAPIINPAIKVKITYPENVLESIRQEKINHIYDILSKYNAE